MPTAVNPNSPAPAAPQATDPLAALRDIHLPEPVSWWPPAPGWWLLAALLLAGLAWLGWRYWQRYQNNAYRRHAVTQLNAAWQRYQKSNDSIDYVKVCNVILRRVALQREPGRRGEIAPLAGQAWFEYLDSCCNQPVFAGSVDATVFDAQYRPRDEQNDRRMTSRLHSAAQKWLQVHP